MHSRLALILIIAARSRGQKARQAGAARRSLGLVRPRLRRTRNARNARRIPAFILVGVRYLATLALAGLALAALIGRPARLAC